MGTSPPRISPDFDRPFHKIPALNDLGFILPDAATTLTRLFGKMKKLSAADALSDGLWQYLSRLIPWGTVKPDRLTFDSTVLERYGEQEGSKRGYNPKKHGRPGHHPLIAFLNTGKYVVHLWNRSGNASSGNNIVAFFNSAYRRVKDSIVLHGVMADSGFYLKEFIEALEKESLIYIIAVRLARPLQREIYALTDRKEIETLLPCRGRHASSGSCL
jgi:hypothetical protein